MIREAGWLRTWCGGHGWIKPNGIAGADVFVVPSEFERVGLSPKVGARVTFEREHDPRGDRAERLLPA